MATLISYASGNLTGSTTFKTTETGTSALALVRANSTTIATATSATSPTFTITNLKVIEGCLLWLYLSSGTAGTGTFKVDLQKGGVSQASVTVNKSDLPDSTNTAPVPVFFKFTGTATGDGGATWTVVITTTSGTGSGVITYNRNSATAADFTRALRTSTTATPAAADDMYIVGELTGAATHNSYTVTMNSTAATAYGSGIVFTTAVVAGGVRTSCYGTLTFGNSASTNYIFRVNGDVEFLWQGTLNMGSSGAEMPRNSSAILEIQQTSASGDFGVWWHHNSTINGAGLSRTSGKNVVKCKLTSDVTSSNVISATTNTNVTITANNGLEATGSSLLASTLADTVTNATHSIAHTGSSLTNTTQAATVWLARGSGTNNRFVRVTMGNATVQSSVANGFFSDIDLQAGTAGTVTAVGNGTATSVSITAVLGGYLIRMIGKVSSGAATPSLLLNACSAAGTVSFAGAGNQCFIYDHVAIVTASSLSDTTFNVDTDTGWLIGDAVCVASTSQAASECELYPLNANAGASSFVGGLYPFSGSLTTNGTRSHSGTSPTQAEVGLLTRNVKIRSTSATLMSFINIDSTSSVNMSWVEFAYLGAGNTTNKHGIEFLSAGSAAVAKSFTFCSVHDAGQNAFLHSNGGSGTVGSQNTTIQNCIVWNTVSTGISQSNALVTASDWTLDNNLVMKTGSDGISLGDYTGTVTNNTVVGAAAAGFFMQSQGGAAYTMTGSFSDNTAHSCTQHAMSYAVTNLSGTINNFKGWRNVTTGVFLFSSTTTLNRVIWNNLSLFGNGTNAFNASTAASCDLLRITGTNVLAGDTTFGTTNIFNFASATLMSLVMDNVDAVGDVSNIYQPATTRDFLFNPGASAFVCVQGTFNNCRFGAPTLISAKSAWNDSSYMLFQKYGQTAGDHRAELTYGQLKADTTIFNTASPSMRATPNSASSKLESAPKGKGMLVAVASGGSATVSVNVRKSVVGDGAAYNGNQPRLVQRANPALGQNSDVVLDTMVVAAGTWEQLIASGSVATDAGAFEYIVDCDGTAGWVNSDDWAAA